MSLKQSMENKDIALIDILDVILDKGVAIKGDLIISIAGVDLVYLDLRVLISSVETLVQAKKEIANPSLLNNLINKRRNYWMQPVSQANGRIHLDPDKAEQGLAQLVMTVIELLRQIVERHAMRRVEGGTLTDEQIENLGIALMNLEEKWTS